MFLGGLALRVLEVVTLSEDAYNHYYKSTLLSIIQYREGGLKRNAA